MSLCTKPICYPYCTLLCVAVTSPCLLCCWPFPVSSPVLFSWKSPFSMFRLNWFEQICLMLQWSLWSCSIMSRHVPLLNPVNFFVAACIHIITLCTSLLIPPVHTTTDCWSLLSSVTVLLLTYHHGNFMSNAKNSKTKWIADCSVHLHTHTFTTPR